MNKYIKFVSNFSILHSYYIVNKRCNYYFDAQLYFNKKLMPESVIKKIINIIKEKKIIIKKPIIFDISKTRKKKEIFLKYLIENEIIDVLECFKNYSLSENFIECFKNKITNMEDGARYLGKSSANLSNKWILNNLDKVPTVFYYTRFFSQNEISQMEDYYEKKPYELRPNSFISWIKKRNII